MSQHSSTNLISTSIHHTNYSFMHKNSTNNISWHHNLAYLLEKIVDIPNLSCSSVHHSVVSLPVSRAQAVSSVSKLSAFHSWRGRGKAGRNKRNELPAGTTWKSPKPSASHLSGWWYTVSLRHPLLPPT